jgi:hypothetical protein
MERRRLTARFLLAAAIAAAVATVLAGVAIARDEITLPVRILANVMVVDSLPAGTAQVAGEGNAWGGMPMGAPGSPVPPGLAPDAPVLGTPAAARSIPKTTAALMTITLDRFSTDDESAALALALKSGGFHGLKSEMEKTTIGYVQLNDKLRLPIRVGSTWKTKKGQVLRLATTEPIIDSDLARASGRPDDSIGLIELTLPAAGPGEGTLVHAIRAGFDDDGRIVARNLALNTGTERLTSVQLVASVKGEEPVNPPSSR